MIQLPRGARGAVSRTVALLACLGLAGCGQASKKPSAQTVAVTAPTTRRVSAPGGVRPGLIRLGTSVLHRAISAVVVGDPAARRRILVVGCVHGNESAGEAITRRLRSVRPPAGSVWWLVDEFNPDGCRAGTRQNADGVDLNRNSPWRWRPLDRPGGTYYSGPGPLSEPESKAINQLVLRLHPAVSIWYHQHAALVDKSSGGDVGIERRYAAVVGLPLLNYGVIPGSITTWQDNRFPHDTAFVVELPAGPVSRRSIARHVAAIRALSRGGLGPSQHAVHR